MNRRFLAVWLLAISAPALAAATSSPPDIRADFLALLHTDPTPLAPQSDPIPATQPAQSFLEEKISFASAPATRVPGFLLKPAAASPTEKLPVVILLHGTGGSKQDMLPLAKILVAKGFLAVAIDGPYHGERTAKGGAGKNTPDYQDALLQAWHDGKSHPFFIDTVRDVMRLIDYLDSRPDVDPARIGCYGVSKGGIETYLAAAADPRIAVAVPCIALESFQWADEHDSWHSRIGTVQNAFDAAAKDAGVTSPDGAFVHRFYDKVAPGIDGEFDGPSIAPLIAPRPFLSINGDSDPRTPQPGLKLATDAVHAAYHAQNADDHFQLLLQKNTAHKVTPAAQAAAVDWFIQWLKPTPQ